MRLDFSIVKYKQLILTLQSKGYFFQTFHEFLTNPQDKAIILRHDIDRLPQNALQFAQTEHKLGVKGSYYFRAVPESWDVKVIKKTASLGHEIGYHYEDIDFAAKIVSSKKYVVSSEKKLTAIAIEFFEKHLAQFRKYYPVKTICMHGSPLSKYDNKLLWKYYDYKDFGIIGEPYFDLAFEDMLYLTDTGRRWDGNKFSIRDKGLGIRKQGLGDPYHDWVVKPKVGSLMRMTEKGVEFQSRYNFRSTNDIIRVAKMGELPDKMMMTFHPQRWSDKFGPWVKELVWQNVKNVGKYFLIRIRD